MTDKDRAEMISWKLIPRIKFWIFNTVGLSLSLCKIKIDKETIDFRANGWIFISDGESIDALPLYLCSEKLISKIMGMLCTNEDSHE